MYLRTHSSSRAPAASGYGRTAAVLQYCSWPRAAEPAGSRRLANLPEARPDKMPSSKVLLQQRPAGD
eukprot:COSAG01_NODE_3845_length_5645_cov_3.828705_2_plen_67_part_00